MSKIGRVNNFLTRQEIEDFNACVSTRTREEFHSFPSTVDKSSIEQRVKDHLEEQFSRELDKYNYLGVDYDRFEVGEEQNLHIDFTKRSDKPDLSSIVYWSGNLKGGQLYFPTEEVEIDPSPGLFVYWTNPVLHGVRKVLKGDRYASSFFWVYR